MRQVDKRTIEMEDDGHLMVFSGNTAIYITRDMGGVIRVDMFRRGEEAGPSLSTAWTLDTKERTTK